FEHEEQKLKLKALQKYADAYKKNNYKNEINFRAWFESIFHVQIILLLNGIVLKLKYYHQ
ncbi:hypothetical protein, partial [Francisella tularensis]|uniref:hypothetical protein n=1 Tax=Francisella tularensis TaxID=263 RepID=UPI001F19D9C7